MSGRTVFNVVVALGAVVAIALVAGVGLPDLGGDEEDEADVAAEREDPRSAEDRPLTETAARRPKTPARMPARPRPARRARPCPRTPTT